MANGGYQLVDLDQPSTYTSYLQPNQARIPIFVLIGVLYSFAPAGVYPARATVGIQEFADDFRFTVAQVNTIFDCAVGSADNAAVLALASPPPAVVPGATPATAPPASGAPPASSAPSPAVPARPRPAPVPGPAGPLPTLGEIAALNTGVGGALEVAEDLGRRGWTVAYRGNQPGVGFDLEASKEARMLRVEVKSSVGLTTPELTESEWAEAQRNGETYVLAIVDFYGTPEQRIWYVRNPARAPSTARTVIVYRVARAGLTGLETPIDDL